VKPNSTAEGVALQGRVNKDGVIADTDNRTGFRLGDLLGRDPIGKNEGLAGETGVEGLLAIVALEETGSPYQQVGILLGKLFPCLRSSRARHALANQEQIRPGDRFVITVCLTLRGGKAAENL